MRDQLPRIGITMRIELQTDRFYLSRHYSEAVHAAGGAAHISLIPDAKYISAVLDNLDVASAWTADGLIEALEDPRADRFALGVQWHPELGWENDSFSRSIFNNFVTEARAHNSRQHAVTAP